MSNQHKIDLYPTSRAKSSSRAHTSSPSSSHTGPHATDDAEGAPDEHCAWHTTYAKAANSPNAKAFTGERLATTPAVLLEQIKAEATPGTQQHAIDLIMPSTLHTAQKCHKDLPHGAEMLLYCGIVDLDAGCCHGQILLQILYPRHRELVTRYWKG